MEVQTIVKCGFKKQMKTNKKMRKKESQRRCMYEWIIKDKETI